MIKQSDRTGVAFQQHSYNSSFKFLNAIVKSVHQCLEMYDVCSLMLHTVEIEKVVWIKLMIMTFYTADHDTTTFLEFLPGYLNNNHIKLAEWEDALFF